MRQLSFKVVVSSLVLLSSHYATASPMGFDESYMAMGDFTNNWQELVSNYAVSPRDAFGLSINYMRSDDKRKTRAVEEFNYTRLLKRWNAPHSQTNFWFIGGVGIVQGKDKRPGRDRYFNKVMVTPGVQFDYETTRLYFSTLHRLYRASNINHDFTSVRAGFSFYEADYDQTQPWFILEARNMNGLSEKIEVTPMLRFINSSFFVEVGVNNFHQPRFNFMYIF
ncbi:MAG: hypothetical protein COB34_08655 [Methylophilaceae bacterium]|nr:MAG: hypothetical protein COB34_08655 [Methylophilaceae bacterium]